VQASIFLARLLGPLLLLPGIGMLANPRVFRAMASEVVGNVTLIYLFGLIDFAAGLGIVLTHNVWVPELARAYHVAWMAFARSRCRPHPVHRPGHGIRQDGGAQQTDLSDFRRRRRRTRPGALLFRLTRVSTIHNTISLAPQRRTRQQASRSAT